MSRSIFSLWARIHKLGKQGNNRIEEMIETTGLIGERKKKIGQLSKGYKQRVGLAQAMLHEPEVLILDEPTAGLDPNQLVEIRELIKNLGKEKTVILSTHIMQEVEAICDRVIIINKGKLVADGKTEELKKQIKGAKVIRVEFKEEVKKAVLEKIDGIDEVSQGKDNEWLLYTRNDQDKRDAVFEFAKENNLSLLTLQLEESRMEEVFQELTFK